MKLAVLRSDTTSITGAKSPAVQGAHHFVAFDSAKHREVRLAVRAVAL
ncbi:MAG: hypothetical protein RLZZ201_954, partial [Actinomycetota bacterium]